MSVAHRASRNLKSRTVSVSHRNDDDRRVDAASLQRMVLVEAVSLLDSRGPPEVFVCREAESRRIYDLLSGALVDDDDVCPLIRVYGPPGTGKSYTVIQQVTTIAEDPTVRDTLEPWWQHDTCMVNAVMLQSSTESLRCLLQKTLATREECDMVLRTYKASGLSVALDVFGQLRDRSSSRVILVIDEADQLPEPGPGGGRHGEPNAASCVHTFLEVARLHGVAVIMIANTLTTVRKTPTTRRTAAGSSELVVFQAYTDKELDTILEQRITVAKKRVLEDLDKRRRTPEGERVIQTFAPFAATAKQLALKRLAAHQGDCRQMLETCRCLLLQKFAEMDATQPRGARLCRLPSSSSEDDESSTAAPSSPRTTGSDQSKHVPSNAISFDDTVRLLERQFQKSKSRCIELLTNLPLHQQILLCAICLVAQEATRAMSSSTVSPPHRLVQVKNIQAGYKKLCGTYQIPLEYNSMNFLEALSSLQTAGVIDIDGSLKLSRPVRGAIRGRRGTVRGGFSRIVGTSHAQSVWKDQGTGAVEILLDETDIRDVLKESKQLFNTWLDENRP